MITFDVISTLYRIIVSFISLITDDTAGKATTSLMQWFTIVSYDNITGISAKKEKKNLLKIPHVSIYFHSLFTFTIKKVFQIVIMVTIYDSR